MVHYLEIDSENQNSGLIVNPQRMREDYSKCVFVCLSVTALAATGIVYKSLKSGVIYGLCIVWILLCFGLQSLPSMLSEKFWMDSTGLYKVCSFSNSSCKLLSHHCML